MLAMLFFISFLLGFFTGSSLVIPPAVTNAADSLSAIEKPRHFSTKNLSGSKHLHHNKTGDFQGGHANYGQETCTPLKNVRGTHFTIPVYVGTPPQRFDVVADTGSSNLIVESCQCRDKGYCEESNKCFVSDRSSSLNVKEGRSGPATVVLMFGSGPIESVIATDSVTMGDLQCTMTEGVLLMVDQLLSFSGPFEGIMGLGLPEDMQPSRLRALFKRGTSSPDEGGVINNSSAPGAQKSPAQAPLTGFGVSPNADVTGIHNGSHQGDFPLGISTNGSSNLFDHHVQANIIWTPEIFNQSSLEVSRMAHRSTEDRVGRSQDAFLQRVGVKRFSLCLSDDGWSGDGGILRLNTPRMRTTFDNIGDMHWALDFRGITIGDAPPESTKSCSLARLPAGQSSPCGAIMDSGTTYILGPKDDIHQLYADICEQWPRCIQNYTTMRHDITRANKAIARTYSVHPWSVQPMDKAMVFSALLRDCNVWFNNSVGFNELPTLKFHIADAGKTMTLDLNPWSYIVSKEQNEMLFVNETIPGFGTFITDYNVTSRKSWSCTPTFGAVDYPTERNGPGWILGIPFFYEYVVHYDLSSQPPSMAFTKEQCGSCEKRAPEQRLNKRPVRLPRRVHGDPRIPSIYFSAPL